MLTLFFIDEPEISACSIIEACVTDTLIVIGAGHLLEFLWLTADLVPIFAAGFEYINGAIFLFRTACILEIIYSDMIGYGIVCVGGTCCVSLGFGDAVVFFAC